MNVEYSVFATDDGYEIVGRIFIPDDRARGAIVIGSAMGVPQEFYAPLANWLAERGYLVVTFDYRGVGHSLNGRLRGFKADIMDWARRDGSAALEQAVRLSRGVPVFWIGHSLGGQIVPLVRNAASLSKIITVACGSGYWRENARPLRYYAWWLWYVAVPLTLPLFGYFPGKRLRKVGDLPAGVILQWRRWCLDRRYSVGVEGPAVEAEYAAIAVPVVSLAFDDDEFMSREGIETLHGFFVNAEVTIKSLNARETGIGRIGHFGFFRRPAAQPLWEQHLLVELH